MKKLLYGLALALALIAPACKSNRLESGGAYAPTNSVVADYAFYQADAAYDLAYATVDAVFKFERDNRASLWALSPDIKHTLDSIRPKAVEYDKLYLTARAAYLKNPTPANLGALQSILSKLQQLVITAQAVIPQQP